jgi:hypothetical protein
MAKTLRRPIDKFERKQRLAQRFNRVDESDFDQRAAFAQLDEEDETIDLENEQN